MVRRWSTCHPVAHEHRRSQRHRHHEDDGQQTAACGGPRRSQPDGGSSVRDVGQAGTTGDDVKAWLAVNPRVVVHFTPTHASWMNMVEIWFGIIERQAIHRGTFTSVPDLNAKIRAFITGWNNRSHPFVWTKTAEQILAKANRQKTSNAAH